MVIRIHDNTLWQSVPGFTPKKEPPILQRLVSHHCLWQNELTTHTDDVYFICEEHNHEDDYPHVKSLFCKIYSLTTSS